MSYEVREGDNVIQSGLALDEALNLIEKKCQEAGKVLPLKMSLDCVSAWVMDEEGKLKLKPTEDYKDICEAKMLLNQAIKEGPPTIEDLIKEHHYMKTLFLKTSGVVEHEGRLCNEIETDGEIILKPISDYDPKHVSEASEDSGTIEKED